jgi:predicted nucleic acid-binding protein
MIVVDTSVWIDFFNGFDTPKSAKLDDLPGVEAILAGDLILAELLQGFKTVAAAQTALKTLSRFEFAPMVGHGVAVASAANQRHLRARGISVRKTMDMLIGTFCILHGHRLLHSDRDFDQLEIHLGLATV